MNIAKNTTVTIDYILTDAEGTLLENTKESGPVAYLHGAGFMIPALEEALEGKVDGDELTVELTPDQAYGERDENLVLKFPRKDFENSDTIEVGEQVQVHSGEDGGAMTVVDLDEEMVTLDGNHPFAGTGIKFELNIRGVRETTQEDIDAVNHDHHHDCGCDHGDDHECCGGHGHGDDEDGCCGDGEKKGGCCGGH